MTSPMPMGLLATDSFVIPVRRRRLPAAQWLVAEAILIVAAAIAAAATDHGFAAAVGRFAETMAGHVRTAPWQLTPVLLLVTALHYLAGAVSFRTAAGMSLPLRQTFRAQLAAAAVSRITPAGIGGAAVNARYLMRKGQDGSQAISSLSALGVLGAIADALVFVAVVLVGSWFGMGGAAHELGALAHKMAGPPVGVWHLLGWTGMLSVALGIALLCAAVGAWRRRRPDAEQRAAKVSRFLRRLRHDLGMQFRELARSPGRLCLLLACSAVTTLSLAVGFLLTAQIGSHPATIGAGGLIIAYMLGGMAGAVAPGPAGIGATEAALAGILISGHMPAAVAISSVMFFRLITFWAPALAGIWALRCLRREGAL